MSGPRVTSGKESKQDYSTPDNFLAAVVKRFGPISFDLAAHRGNKKHARYFAPRDFVVKVERGESDDLEALIADAVRAGANPSEARRLTFEQFTGIRGKGKIVIPNRDPDAAAFDAFRDENGRRRIWRDFYDGQGWLNCEFGDVEPWAAECAWQMNHGSSSLLLTPAVCTNWYRDIIAGVADVYDLSGRLCYDGKNVFPKDCRLSHFHPKATGKVCIWEWASDRIHMEWDRIPFLTKRHPRRTST